MIDELKRMCYKKNPYNQRFCEMISPNTNNTSISINDEVLKRLEIDSKVFSNSGDISNKEFDATLSVIEDQINSSFNNFETNEPEQRDQNFYVEDVKSNTQNYFESTSFICNPQNTLPLSVDEKSIMDSDMAQNKTDFKKPASILCKECSFSTTRPSHYLSHIKLHEKSSTSYKCDECGFVCLRKSVLTKHKVSHAQYLMHCNYCSYKCSDIKVFEKHRKRRHGDGTSEMKEKKSSIFFKQKSFVENYSKNSVMKLDKKNQKSSEKLKCSHCDYKTANQSHMKRHSNTVHREDRPHLCDVCGGAFKTNHSLKQHHIAKHYNLDELNSCNSTIQGHICNICKKVCRSSTDLKEHLLTHSEERTFLCEVCGATFKTKSVQRMHILTVHRNSQSYSCSRCSKKFTTKFNLNRHLKRHEGNYSNSSSKSSSNLLPLNRKLRANKSANFNSHTSKKFYGNQLLDNRINQKPTSSFETSADIPYHLPIDSHRSFYLHRIEEKASCDREPTGNNDLSLIGDHTRSNYSNVCLSAQTKSCPRDLINIPIITHNDSTSNLRIENCIESPEDKIVKVTPFYKQSINECSSNILSSSVSESSNMIYLPNT